jgi:hypothetical protein
VIAQTTEAAADQTTAASWIWLPVLQNQPQESAVTLLPRVVVLGLSPQRRHQHGGIDSHESLGGVVAICLSGLPRAIREL